MTYKKRTAIKEPNLKVEKKLTTAELIYIGQFTTRVATTISALENEKKTQLEILEKAENIYGKKTEELDAKIELITSDPVKYFRILDAQIVGAAVGTFGMLGVSEVHGKATAIDNGNLTKEKLDSILNRVNDIYSQGTSIGNMIYDGRRKDFEPLRFKNHFQY